MNSREAEGCLLHRNIFSLAHLFQKCTTKDQVTLFRFIDAYLPENHGLYFLCREVLAEGQSINAAPRGSRVSTVYIDDGLERDKGNRVKTDAFEKSPRYELIRTVRDLSSQRAAQDFSRQYHKEVGSNVYTYDHDEENEYGKDGRKRTGPRSGGGKNANEIYDDDENDSEYNNDSENGDNKKSAKKGRGRKTDRRDNEEDFEGWGKRGTVGGNKRKDMLTRNVYRLINSASENSVERHYEIALEGELGFYDDCKMDVKYEGRTLTSVHVCGNVRLNTIYPGKKIGRDWYDMYSDALRKTVRYRLTQDKSGDELDREPPINFNVEFSIARLVAGVGDGRMVNLKRDTMYLQKMLEDRVADIHRVHEEEKRKRLQKLQRKRKRDEDEEEELMRWGKKLRPEEIIMQLDKIILSKTEFKRNNQHLMTISELTEMCRFITHAAETRMIKLVDFAVFGAKEAWYLMNSIMAHGLKIYKKHGSYPIKDSLSNIVLVDMIDQPSHVNDEDNEFSVKRYMLTWPNGGVGKLGDIVTFVQTFRRVMRNIVSVCCCYFMERRAVNVRGFVEKHICQMPKAIPGVYQSLFMRMAIGHELLCTHTINDRSEAISWLLMYANLSVMLWRKRQIPACEQLLQHMSELSNMNMYTQQEEEKKNNDVAGEEEEEEDEEEEEEEAEESENENDNESEEDVDDLFVGATNTSIMI